MYKTLYMGHDEEQKAIQDTFGHYNDFPPGWEELTAEQFAKSQMLDSEVTHIERRQMNRPPELLSVKNGFMTARLYHTGNGLGYALVSDYWAGTVRFFKFDSLAKIKADYQALPAVSDSGWSMLSSSNPSRGIRNYQRTIEFARALTEREWELVKVYLARDNCPGWTGIHGRAAGNNTYVFNTTYDSSD